MKLRHIKGLIDCLEMSIRLSAGGDPHQDDQQAIDMMRNEVEGITIFLEELEKEIALLSKYFAHVQKCMMKVTRWTGVATNSAINAESQATSLIAKIQGVFEEIQPEDIDEVCTGQTDAGEAPEADPEEGV